MNPASRTINIPARKSEKMSLHTGCESIIINLAEGSHLDLQEMISCSNNCALDMQIILARGASMKHRIIQNCGREIELKRVQNTKLDNESSYSQSILSLGAKKSHHHTSVELNGENASVEMKGAYICSGQQVMDNYLPVKHNAKNCRSSQNFRGVLTDKAKGIFHGVINVAEGASGTHANQQSRALLLSPDAEADNRPELEILNDDVACAHGAAIGNIDENALYYLMARGIDATSARMMLIEAFITGIFAEDEANMLALAQSKLLENAA